MQQEPSKEQAQLDQYNKGLTDSVNKLRIEHAFNLFAESAADDQLSIDDALVGSRIWSKLPPSTVIISKSKRLWSYFVAPIAAAVAIIVFGLWYFVDGGKEDKIDLSELRNKTKHISPGHAGATLRLASGQKINLSDVANGTLLHESGINISKTEDGELVYQINASGDKSSELNVLTTLRGETYRLHLPDGTMVWLNAASSLSFSAGLIQAGERMVELKGEAYFEVSKDAKHPFVVKTDKQEVEVLGTKFNINSYQSDESVATTLLEGAVRVSTREVQRLLKPGEQVLNDGINMSVKTVDVAAATAWKDGYFRFNDQKMSEIVKQLERWYNVDIELSKAIADRQFTGKISRNRNIIHILELMQETNQINFKIEGRRIFIIDK
jgi:transmembrane sensor